MGVWLIRPVRVTRSRAGTDRPGWDQIRFACFHKRPGLMRGEPALVDTWEAEAKMNPCRLIACPERVRPIEERP